MDEVEWWDSKKHIIALAEPTKDFIELFMTEVAFFGTLDWVKDKYNQKVLKNRLKQLL